MEKNKVFVMTDIHGEFTMMKELLKKWNPKEEQLIILGDLADRGPSSKETLELAYHLVQNEEAIVIKGNHDDMLEKYLEDPIRNQGLYYMNGGGKTIESLLGEEVSKSDHKENVRNIKERYPWLLSFLKSMRYSYEWENYLFVHAGVDLTLDDWRDSTKRDFIWIREGFYDQKNHTGKTIIFGHTVTASLHKDLGNYNIWKSGDGLIGIDGGAVYGGKLHALLLSKERIEKHYMLAKK